jgi:hypothetical protein
VSDEPARPEQSITIIPNDRRHGGFGYAGMRVSIVFRVGERMVRVPATIESTMYIITAGRRLMTIRVDDVDMLTAEEWDGSA